MPYSAAAKAAAKAYVADVRARTVCAECGAQPVEWHHDDHLADPNRRVAHLAALGFPLAVIEAEIARCVPLCRACHMAADGRAAALTAARPFKPGTSLPPQPCVRCGVLAKPRRRSMCRRCYDHVRRSP